MKVAAAAAAAAAAAESGVHGDASSGDVCGRRRWSTGCVGHSVMPPLVTGHMGLQLQQQQRVLWIPPLKIKVPH